VLRLQPLTCATARTYTPNSGNNCTIYTSRQVFLEVCPVALDYKARGQMATDLAGLGLPPAVLQSLNSRSIFTVRDVLQQSATDLMELLNISYTGAEQLLQNVCLNSAPAYITAGQLYSMLHSPKCKVTTSMPGLDDALRIGIPPGMITEVWLSRWVLLVLVRVRCATS